MTPDEIWRPLTTELARWRQTGRTAEFWLRDDDAIEPTAALDRLLAMTAARAPVALAVIPAWTGAPLAERLARENHVTVAVHGWSHENHALQGEKKQELGRHLPREVVLAELSEGRSRLELLHAGRFAPVLVPPWNRIDADLLPHLAGIGFSALSVFGAPRPSPLRMLNSTVDIMDWRGNCGRDHAALIAEIVAQLEAAFRGVGGPVGLLSHHLVHDEVAWSFLDRLFEVTEASGACRWRSLGELLA
ncbi:polysaccharide deacetylase family protein [Mesorhizobium sp. WSM2239]|uniref:Polysaccharide deacetylase family protein n=2 Tax=unclassified Mesorhizobium TaxID=325217 RepID=A0AAU8D7C4_9HYPH